MLGLLLTLGATFGAAAAGGTPNTSCPGDSNGEITSSASFTAMPAPNLVPWPQAISISAGYFYPNASTLILVNGNASVQAALRPAAELLASEIALVTGGKLTPKVEAETTKYIAGPHIHLFQDDLSQFTGDESSTRIAEHGAVLSARSYAGMMSATAVLLQALEKGTDGDGREAPKCTSGAPAWRLPILDVEDGPAFGIRGVMVDAAREFLPLSNLKEYVILCRLYKVRVPLRRGSSVQAQPLPVQGNSSHNHLRLRELCSSTTYTSTSRTAAPSRSLRSSTRSSRPPPSSSTRLRS